MFSCVSFTSSRRFNGCRVNGHVSFVVGSLNTRHHVSYPATCPYGEMVGSSICIFVRGSMKPGSTGDSSSSSKSSSSSPSVYFFAPPPRLLLRTASNLTLHV
eukprot:31499-Pelagococcus_subviridis.AAC.52